MISKTNQPPADNTYWVEFIGDRSIKIKEGQTILEASLANGIPHYHACGGNGECSTCRVFVQRGKEFLTPVSEKEQAMRSKIPFAPDVRLACQTYIKGTPVALHRIIRDETDIRIYIDEEPSDDLMHTGHERELALFFLDIRDFTPFLEANLPFDVIHIMRRMFALFRKNIEAHGGRIIETAGDGFYAVFGFETAIATACDNALAAAHSILKDLAEFNGLYVQKHFFHQFEVGIGIHAGTSIVGNIGIGVNNNLTVMGLPVNIASRIQAVTRACNNSLIVSDVFFNHLPQKPQSQPIDTKLKGLKEEFRLHLCGTPFK